MTDEDLPDSPADDPDGERRAAFFVQTWRESGAIFHDATVAGVACLVRLLDQARARIAELERQLPDRTSCSCGKTGFSSPTQLSCTVDGVEHARLACREV